MKKIALIAVLATVVAMPAFANADLAQKKSCLACHAVDKKLVGPAYKEVAAKYAGQKDAATKLAEKNSERRRRHLGPDPDARKPAGQRRRGQATGRLGAVAEVI